VRRRRTVASQLTGSRYAGRDLVPRSRGYSTGLADGTCSFLAGPCSARDWVVVRMLHNAMWEVQDQPEAPDEDYLTTCITIAKAVQD
jgi:hypothetical protein